MTKNAHGEKVDLQRIADAVREILAATAFYARFPSLFAANRGLGAKAK